MLPRFTKPGHYTQNPLTGLSIWRRVRLPGCWKWPEGLIDTCVPGRKDSLRLEKGAIMRPIAVFLLLSLCIARAQVGPAQAKVPPCDKLPYRLGHLVILNTTDLRDHPRAITKAESKEMSKKMSQAQAECNAFVSKSPGHQVSTDLSFTIKGFAAYYERCDSFCGTDKEWEQLIQKEADDASKPPQK